MEKSNIIYIRKDLTLGLAGIILRDISNKRIQMTHLPDCNLNLDVILKAYYIQLKEVPSMRFGQYFMNIAFSRVHDSTLFYETDMNKAILRIYELYAYPDGELHSIEGTP